MMRVYELFAIIIKKTCCGLYNIHADLNNSKYVSSFINIMFTPNLKYLNETYVYNNCYFFNSK